MELEIAGSKVNKDLLPNDAVVNRDSCSKTIYSKLFDWLVETINEKCSDPSSEHLRTNFIGILDIFGFEIFEINGFEQVSFNNFFLVVIFFFLLYLSLLIQQMIQKSLCGYIFAALPSGPNSYIGVMLLLTFGSMGMLD